MILPLSLPVSEGLKWGVYLAAQTGVRYDPHVYVEHNLGGLCNILEVRRHYSIQHLGGYPTIRAEAKIQKFENRFWLV